MSKSLREMSRTDWSSPDSPTYSQIDTGSLLRIADATEHFYNWARSFRGCDLVKAVERVSRTVANGAITVRVEHVWRLEIRWPWKQRKQVAERRRAARARRNLRVVRRRPWWAIWRRAA